MKDSKWYLLNPLWWVAAAWEGFRQAVGSILRLFGVDVPGQRQHADITPEDVTDAYNDAAAAEVLPETFGPEIDSKVNRFFRYIQMSSEERTNADLSAFSTEEQDFILSLSDAQIETLRERGSFGALQAVLIKRIPEWHEPKTAPEMKPGPSRADMVKEAFLRRVGGSTEQRPEALTSEFLPLQIR